MLDSIFHTKSSALPTHIVSHILTVTLLTFIWGNIALAEEISPSSRLISDGRAWLNMQLMGDTGIEKWKWYLEVQPRWRDNAKSMDQRLIRPAIIYELSEDTSIWFGYVNVQGFGRTGDLRENRLWQQFLTKFQPNEHFSIKSQTRFEQRTFEGFKDVGYKIRHKFAMYIPFAKTLDLSALLYDEVHHNFNSTDYGAARGFEQNRIFVGVEWKPKKNFSIETGYLNQYFDNRGQPDQSNHIFATTINYQFE